jgi:lipopolysaccharide/colanic/teichoic acid biosynthesis glycosyltransferase
VRGLSYGFILKRLVDVVLSLSALLVLSPLMIGIAILVRWQLGRPIFFCQQRPGLHGEPFTIIKFRTMISELDETADSLNDAERLARFGQLLRATSLDELPELWNVLVGDMSFVGPRPLLMEYLQLYTPEQQRRHDVRPGITGWAQVNGRNAISWDDKFKLDVWYVDNQSLWLDLRIMGMTAKSVLLREGISHPGEATTKKFSGND